MNPAGWRPAVALSTAVGALAILLLLAVLLRRQDLLVIALPLAVGTVLPLLRRCRVVPEVRFSLGGSTLGEGEATVLHAHTRVAGVLDLFRMRIDSTGWTQLPDSGGHNCLPGGSADWQHRVVGSRWGRSVLQPSDLTAVTGHGLLWATLPIPAALHLNTLPSPEGFTATDLVPNAAGIVGLHRSLRLGEGIDPAGVRPFTSGDRLRRIHWPISLRTGDLHVTATYSERDTEVVLVLDTSTEVGRSGELHGDASSLDVAVRAAAAIATHYLATGDRVGLLNLARAARPIRSRAGRGQLVFLSDQLLDARPESVGEPVMSRALARISARALVIVLSPMLSDELAAGIAGLSRSGRAVVVVDTLPDDVVWPEVDAWTDVAWRIQLLRRENLMGALAEQGVPSVRWRGAGSLDQVLAGLSRLASAPKVRR